MNPSRPHKEETGLHKGPPKLKDIAVQAGVSIPTVSVILGGGPKAEMYSAKTRRKVWALAREMGYTPNLLARSLKSGKSKIIGVVMSNQYNSYYGRPLRAAEQKAAELGYEIMTADMKWDFSRFERCIQMMASWNVEGLILMTGGRLVNTSMISMLRDTGIPYVKGGVFHPDDACSTIVFNSHDAGRLMARHLFEMGHRHVGFIAAHASNVTSEERIRGVMTMAREMKIPEDCLKVIHPPDANVGLDTGYRLLDETLRCHPQLTAMLFHSDKMAIGGMRLLHEKGLSVPADISVAGFDDICLDQSNDPNERLGGYLWPALTTVRTPMDEIGMECVRMLVEMMQNPSLRETPRTTVFPPKLVVRESTGPAATKSVRTKII